MKNGGALPRRRYVERREPSARFPSVLFRGLIALAGIKAQNVLMINGWRQTRRQQPTFIMTKPHIAQKSPIVQPAEPGEYWWCSCGLSATQPFCNGAHKGTGLAPLKVQITEAKTVAWCACKQTKTPPFCDGSHRTLA